MMKRMIFILILLGMTDIGWADEYVLVMSKEDNVCQQMLGLYNEDLRKYGEVKYEEHKEFTAIKWEEKKYYTTYPDGKKHYMDDNSALMSRFDINNDGEKDVVIKIILPVRDRPSESLYYVLNEDATYFKDEEFDVKTLYTKAAGAAGTTGAAEAFKGNSYALKELPKAFLPAGQGYPEAKFYYSLGGWFFLNPFVFKGMHYIDIRDEDPLETEKFLVILKYTKDNELKDICYYLKAIDCKTKTQRRK